MTLNRRVLLRTLLMSPFFGAARKLSASSMFTPTVSGTVNILLHGLFFMELDKSDGINLLVIRAPRVGDHTFLSGTRKNLQPCTGFDWSKGSGLTGGNPTPNNQTPTLPQVSTSILQFTRDETGVGSFKEDANLYFGKVILPWPRQITPLRLDHFPPIDLGDNQHQKHVAPKLNARCGTSQIGDVICLQYDFSAPVLPPANPTMNFHLHMLCCKDADFTVDHINAALTEAAGIFTASENFDLQLQHVAVVATQFDDHPSVTGVLPEDERAAIEDGACGGVPASSTPSVKKLPPHSKINQKTTKRHVTKKPMGEGENIHMENVSPANCPSFFVG